MYVCMYFNHLKKKICRFQYVCIIVVVVVVVVVLQVILMTLLMMTMLERC